MSQIKPRPITQKTAIMDAKQEDAYRETFRGTICEACGINDGTVVPAHFNLHAGGTGYRAKGIIAGLCFACHDIVDRRVRDEKRRMWILERLCQKLLRDRARAWVETSPNETEKPETN